MAVCSKMKRDLLLYIHGALDDRDRAELESHLRECKDCRDERARLTALLGRIRETSQPQELSASETDEIVSGVHRRLKAKPAGWLKHVFSGSHFPLIPVAAAACMAVIVSLFAYQTFNTERRLGNPAQQQQQLTQQEVEIIRHLDLLRNMDTIQRLVQIVDETDKDEPGGDSAMEIRRIRHKYRSYYG